MAVNIELVIIGISWVLSAALLSIWLVHYYAHKHVSSIVRVVTFLSWLTCFCIPFVLPLDIQSDYHDSLNRLWTALYIIISIGCWMVAPWLKTYYDNGGFTFRDKVKYIVWDEIKFYSVAILVGAGLIIYLIIKESLRAKDIVGVFLALSNTFGLALLTLTLGYGLVNLPLSIYKSSNRSNSLRFLLYKIGKLNEKMSHEQDRLQQTHAYIHKVENDISPELHQYFQIIKKKCPHPQVYEFAHIGMSHAIESFSRLEKIQKKSPDDLKYKDLITLHHIVILHRRTYATYQAEWYDTLKRYGWLNRALLLTHEYPRPHDLPQTTLVESDPATFKNFPLSILWTLPCCCCCNNRRRYSDYDQHEGDLIDASAETLDGLHLSSRDGNHFPSSSSSSSSSSRGVSPSDQYLGSNSRHVQTAQTDSIYDRKAYRFAADISGDNTDEVDDDNANASYNYDIETNETALAGSSSMNHLDSSRYAPHNPKLQGGLVARCTQFRFGAWLFRDPPPLTPGSCYYFLSWKWFQYVLYYQPTIHRILAVLLGLLSILVLWCEISILIPTDLSPISLLTRLKGASAFIKLFLTITPLVYIIICTYFTLFRLQISSYYHMHGPKKSGASSILWNVSFMLRMILPTAYNYFRMIRAEKTAFASVIGTMEAIPLLGRSFNTYVPILVVVIAIFTATNCWGRLLRVLKIPQFDYSLGDPESEQVIEDGRILVDRDNTRRTGQPVEHYRGKHVPPKSLQDSSSSATAKGGDDHGDGSNNSNAGERFSSRFRTRQKEEAERQEEIYKASQPYASSHGQDSSAGNQSPSTVRPAAKAGSGRYRFHSEREKAIHIDDL